MEDLQNGAVFEEIEGIDQTLGYDDIPWVLFTVADVVYGIHSSYILSIEILGMVTPIVNSAPYTRGMTNFRGDMINLTELRILFGKQNRIQEYYDVLAPKIEAHVVWVETLRECIREQKPFTLATDPHCCAFGKWYYSYKTDNNTVLSYLKQFEAPHEKLHRTGAVIMKHVEDGEQEEAERLLAEVVEPLCAEVLKLFEGAMEVFREGTNEMLIVLDVDGCSKGIIVDDIVAVEYISDTISVHDHFGNMSQIKQIGKREKDGSPILLFDEEFIAAL